MLVVYMDDDEHIAQSFLKRVMYHNQNNYASCDINTCRVDSQLNRKNRITVVGNHMGKMYLTGSIRTNFSAISIRDAIIAEIIDTEI